jgi:hypothetical protein
MSDQTHIKKIQPFISHLTRAGIYGVLAAYAEAGIGFEAALKNLAEANAEKHPEVAEVARSAAEHDGSIGTPLLAAFSGAVPNEAALLAALPAIPPDGDGRKEALRVAAILLAQAASAAESA